MLRPLRIEFPGAIDHVMARRHPGAPLFRSSSARSVFVETLGEIAARADVRVPAYCPRDNHVHLVMETPGASRSASMKWLLKDRESRSKGDPEKLAMAEALKPRTDVTGRLIASNQGWESRAT